MEHNINKHISGRFNEELENVRNHVLNMGGLVEQQLNSALDAVSNGDADLAQKVRENDYKVNAMEVNIDEECTRIIARRQPAAGPAACFLLGRGVPPPQGGGEGPGPGQDRAHRDR